MPLKIQREPSVVAPSLESAPRGDGSTPPDTEERSDGVAWWLWPHLWSLDAPLVAVVWQRWWARAAGTAVTPAQEAALALAVWMIYLADRLVDAEDSGPGLHGTARHAFYRTRRGVVRPLVLGLGLFLTAAAPWCLGRREFGAGLCLLALAAGYFWMIHRRARHSWTAFCPKEAAVGGLFALGSFLFVGCRGGVDNRALLLAVAGFGTVCFLNCALITRWEDSALDRLDPASLPNAFPVVARRLGVGCWVTAAALGVCTPGGGVVFLPLAVSAGLLGILDAVRARIPVNALRVLADVMLLTPWCFLPFSR